MRRKIPIHITLFLTLVLYILCWQVIRLITSIEWNDTLGLYESRLVVTYIMISGAVWILTGLFLLWSMWRGEPWTRKAFTISSSVYALWVWADRLFVQAQLRANWLFDLVLTIVLFAFAIFVVLDPHNKIYFERETYERESKN